MLRNFWPKEKIATWEAALFPDGPEEHGLETARNMITLSSNAHHLWNMGAFALKPISVSEDNTTLIIQFFWQTKQPLAMPTINLLAIPLSTKHLDRHSESKSSLSKWSSSETLIKSGDLFELTTDDPEARPLPSVVLLEMQWFLQRVAGMAGAADELEDFEYHFSDDGLLNWRLDDGGDESFLSNVTGALDPIVPDNDSLLPSIEAPNHPVEKTEECEVEEAAR
jgi:hypothetical protein